ncbi:MAG: hypothetical protein AB7D47_04380 [Desulfovibrio sp.]|jgi:hypothetical protein
MQEQERNAGEGRETPEDALWQLPIRGSGRIDQDLLVELVVRREWTQRRAAEFFGVSESAVSKAMRRMRLAVNRDVAMRSAPKLLEAQLEGGDRLSGLVRQVEELLALLRLVIDGDQSNREVFEARTKLRRLAGPKANLGDFAVKLLSEARKQLEFVFSMQREIYSLRRTEEFQEIVMSEVGKADPETQRRIVNRLVEVHALRSSLDLETGV